MAYRFTLHKKTRGITVDYFTKGLKDYVWVCIVDFFTVPETKDIDAEFSAVVSRLSAKCGDISFNEQRTAAFVTQDVMLGELLKGEIKNEMY